MSEEKLYWFKLSDYRMKVGKIFGGWYDGLLQVQEIESGKIYISAPDEMEEIKQDESTLSRLRKLQPHIIAVAVGVSPGLHAAVEIAKRYQEKTGEEVTVIHCNHPQDFLNVKNDFEEQLAKLKDMVLDFDIPKIDYGYESLLPKNNYPEPKNDSLNSRGPWDKRKKDFQSRRV